MNKPLRIRRISVAIVLGFGLTASGCGHYRTDRETDASKRYIKNVRLPPKSPKVAHARKPPTGAPIEPRLMVAPEPMSCMVERLDLERTKEKTGFSPDPKLVEIARLEQERACFQQSDVATRARLLELQDAVKQIQCICR